MVAMSVVVMLVPMERPCSVEAQRMTHEPQSAERLSA
jgi:hypothetical protein